MGNLALEISLALAIGLAIGARKLGIIPYMVD
jgi:hypothetical protein